MFAFWRDSSLNKSEAIGHELLLTACATCLVTVGRRYPLLARGASRQHRHDRRGHVDEAVTSGHIFAHVFGRLIFDYPYVVTSSWRKITSRISREMLSQNASFGLTQYLRQVDTYIHVTRLTPLLQNVSGLPLHIWRARSNEGVDIIWLAMRGTPVEFDTEEQISPLSLLLALLILAGCQRSACAIMASAIEYGQPDSRSEVDGAATSSRSYLMRSESKLRLQTADAGCEFLQNNVNDSGGFLLWLAANHDDCHLPLPGLHKLGTRIDTQMPHASSAVYKAIANDNMGFVQQLLQLYCRQAVGTDSVLRTDRLSAHMLRCISNTDWGSPSWDKTSARMADLQECRRVMRTFAVYTDLISEPSPLTFALVYGGKHATAMLLETHPACEDLLGTCGSALVDRYLWIGTRRGSVV